MIREDIHSKISITLMLKLIRNNWLILLLSIVIGFYIGSIKKHLASNIITSVGVFEVSDNHVTPAFELENANQNPYVDDNASSKMLVNAVSHDVLAEVVTRLHLDIDVQPVKLPLVGRVIFNYFSETYPNELVKPMFFSSLLSKYAFGGQKLKVHLFDVPDSELSKAYQVKIISPSSYLLLKDNKVIIMGTVATLEKTVDGRVSIFIDSIAASNGQYFEIQKQPLDNQINQLINKLQLEKVVLNQKLVGKQIKTNVAKISLTGTDELETSNTVNLIMNLIKDNSLKSKQELLKKSSAYINNQVESVENSLKITKKELAEFKKSRGLAGSFDEQHSINTNSLNLAKKELADAKMNLSSLKKNYGVMHPIILLTQEKIVELNKQVKELEQLQKMAPTNDTTLKQLEADIALKESILSQWKTKQDDVNLSLINLTSDVKILDYADVDKSPSEAIDNKYIFLFPIFVFMLVLFLLVAFSLSRNRTPYLLSEFFNIDTTSIIKYNNNLNKAFIFDKELYVTLDKLMLQLFISPNKYKSIGLFSIAEGVGVTSLTALLAVILSKNNYRVLIVSIGNFLPEKYKSFDNELSDIKALQVATTSEVNDLFYSAEITYQYDFILIDYGNIKNKLSDADSFTYLSKIMYITSTFADVNCSMETASYLERFGIPITDVIYNYTKKQYIHDFYSK